MYGSESLYFGLPQQSGTGIGSQRSATAQRFSYFSDAFRHSAVQVRAPAVQGRDAQSTEHLQARRPTLSVLWHLRRPYPRSRDTQVAGWAIEVGQPHHGLQALQLPQGRLHPRGGQDAAAAKALQTLVHCLPARLFRQYRRRLATLSEQEDENDGLARRRDSKQRKRFDGKNN